LGLELFHGLREEHNSGTSLAALGVMLPRSTPHLSAATHALRRDRSIIALAAALCGALSAAGVAALAVVSQLSVNTGERAMRDATDALETATEELSRSRTLLLESRRELASAPTHSCDHRPKISPQKGLVAHLPAPPPLAHPALNCDEEHRCTVHRNFLEAAFRGARWPRCGALVPQLRDGVFVGLRIYGVRHGDPAEFLGFRDRDTILAINGTPLQGMGPSGVLGHIQDIRAGNPSSLTITIERSGELLAKRFDLVD